MERGRLATGNETHVLMFVDRSANVGQGPCPQTINIPCGRSRRATQTAGRAAGLHIRHYGAIGFFERFTIDNMLETFILIPGRTTDQGCGVSEGKFKDKYQNAVRALQVAPGDMARLGLSEGDRVRLTGEEGQSVEVCITAAKKDELPEGLLFIAYGDISSQLMTGDTHGSGMPTSKGMEVTMELLARRAS